MTNLDRTVETLGALTREELQLLQIILDEMLLIGSKSEQENKGYIENRMVKKTLSDGTVKEYGPYKYLHAYHNGKPFTKYLGKSDG